MSKLRIEEVFGVDKLSALRAEWRDLFTASDVSPFLCWEWIATWQEWLGNGRTPYLICARQGEELLGLAPLSLEELPLPGLPFKARRLSFLGEEFGGADYLDLLVLPERGEEVASAIFDHLARRVHFDILELDNIASDSPNLPLLAKRFRSDADFHYRLTPRFVCPQVELNGDWSATLERKRGARAFKQRLRRLRERDGFEYRIVTRPEEAEAAWERFLKLHEAHYIHRGGSDLTGHQALRSFHRDVVIRLAEVGLLRFDELWAEGACRASIYRLDDGWRSYCFNCGYDPEWKKSGPGQALLGLTIEDSIKRGVKRYDFLRGTEDYKFDWATSTRETVSVLITRHTIPAMLFTTRRQTWRVTRAAAKALLPEQAIAWMRRRWRSRRWERELKVGIPTAF
jgi:CelD/BcsL family acetyltransferase involved in cellulose biosynthesis